MDLLKQIHNYNLFAGMERNHRLVTLCHNRLIFNLQDFLTMDDDDHKYKSFDKTDKIAVITDFQKNYSDALEDVELGDFESKDKIPLLCKIKATFNGVYEIISEDTILRTRFFDCLIEQIKTNRSVFVLSNRLNLTHYPNKNIQTFLVTRYVDLQLYLNLLYEHLRDKQLRDSIILINDFTSICYELDVLPVHFKITVELVSVCRKLVDLTKATILCGSLPRKSGNIQQLNIGGIMPSPWRNLPCKYIYLTNNGNQVVAKVENTFECTLEIIDLSELNNF